MQEFLPILQDALITISGAVITLLAAYAVKAINVYTVKLQTEASKVQEEGLRSLASEAIWRASQLATTTVAAIEQTTAGTLRIAVKEGNAKPEELKKLADGALARIIELLGPEYYNALKETFGDVEEYLADVIEQKVLELKRTLPAKE